MIKLLALLSVAAFSSFGQSNLRAIPFSFGSNDNGPGQPLAAGAIEYLSVPFSCPISGIVSWDLSVDQGSIGIELWRKHWDGVDKSNPTEANKITGNAMPSITNGNQRVVSSNMPGWDRSMQQHDEFAAYVAWVQGGTTQATLVLACK